MVTMLGKGRGEGRSRVRKRGTNGRKCCVSRQALTVRLFGRDKSTTVGDWAHGKQRVAISAAMDAEDDDDEIKYDVALCATCRRVGRART